MEPPSDRGDDEKLKPIIFRSDWFSQFLGEGWTPDGEGIYRPSSSHDAPDPPEERGTA
jgi:hypothetical protein